MGNVEKEVLPHYFTCDTCGWVSSSLKTGCPVCGKGNIVELQVSGSGVIIDFVPIAYAPKNLQHLGKYTSVLVKLDEGCKMFGIIEGDGAGISIGTHVTISNFNNDTKEVFFKAS
jgi:uncharacterized OB-fold protein